MISLYCNIFGVILDLNINFPKRRKRRNVYGEKVEMPINENIANEEYNSFDEVEEHEENAEKRVSEIQSQALRFEEELKQMGIYDIPNASDIPPTYEIQDDVEIITNEFEKEQQDMIKDRRK